MLILECILQLNSMQADVTCAFLHAELEESEKIYCEMPLGFRRDGKILKLKRNLYGLRQAPRNFYKYTIDQMKIIGMKQSKHDPCLFIGDTVICVTYADDLLFWSKDDAEIDASIESLKLLGVDLEKEGDASGYLGVKLEKDSKTGEIVMTQEGLAN